MRRAVGRHAGAAATPAENAQDAQGVRSVPGAVAGASARPDAASEPADAEGRPAAVSEPSEVRAPDTVSEPATDTGRPDPAPETGEAGRPGGGAESSAAGPGEDSASSEDTRARAAAAGTSRPGDAAREALRAARTQAERERTTAPDKGVGARRRRGGTGATPPGPRPARSSHEVAAQVREMAERLGNTFDLSSRMEREGRTDEPGTGPAAAEAPSVDEPSDGAPSVEGPSVEVPSVEGPFAEAPSVGEPSAEAPSVDEPFIEAPSVEEPPGEAPFAEAPSDETLPADAPSAGFRSAAGGPEPGRSGRITTPPLHTPPAEGGAPAPPVARSMAAPARDGELRRTFPALAARPHGVAGFAETWWGNAWVAALEETALDAARLGRGKAYAGQGHVDAITVTPGLVLAYVHGSRPRPYRVQIRMRTLTDDDWERFLDAAAERPGHIAALLDKDLPQALADGGVDLLPGPGDLVPRCSCPDSGHPCKHAAALCYQTARLLDEDPFVLLLLRGRGERELLDELSRRNATLAARSARSAEQPALPGVPARDAVQARVRAPLPAPLPPPAHPEQPPAYPASPGGPDPFALDQLATDAAARAHALLTTGRDPLAGLTLWQDAVRLAATRPGSGLTATTRAFYASLAAAAGRTPADLARAVAAWRQGGLEGLAVLEEPWDPPAGRFDRARPLLLAADFPAFRPWHNHLTHPRGHIQLRLGHDGLWYGYESEPDHDDWWPRGTPDLDPVGALTGLGSPTEL
ncbi:SWIM zinc finger family protein [Streptomyces sp. NPDC002701]|uniref:SWIM zinc finger family protein n=1 Tax=Streptomyces sp. NPDC002701 TaxID=3364661 RepID=UPI0036C79487